MILIILLFPFALFGAPVYLTWGSHPESSMTIQWITGVNETSNVITLVDGPSFQGTSAIFPHDSTYLVHKATITQLKSDTTYKFKLPDGTCAAFKTMPQTLCRKVGFIVCGDCYHDSLELLEHMSKLAAKQNPDFCLIGGDIAYTSSTFATFPESTKRWIEWIDTYSKTMVRGDGTLIPLIPAIGNHDVNGRYSQTPEQAKSFYTLFSTMPGPNGYQALDFGSYMSLFVLDTGHTHPIEGAQTAWLKEALSSRRGQKYKFALYHVPAYPSCRKMTTLMSPEVRAHFVPLFEEFGLNAAFENHDHCYKRTYQIKGGKAVDRGVLYIGDGGFAVEKPRTPRPKEEIPLIEKTASKTHFVFVSLSECGVAFQAIDRDGVVFDEKTNLFH